MKISHLKFHLILSIFSMFVYCSCVIVSSISLLQGNLPYLIQ